MSTKPREQPDGSPCIVIGPLYITVLNLIFMQYSAKTTTGHGTAKSYLSSDAATGLGAAGPLAGRPAASASRSPRRSRARIARTSLEETPAQIWPCKTR